jgi:flagellar biosynthetic protein FliR
MLAQFLVSELFAFLLIFTRIGAGVMLMPGVGEYYVPMRVRLMFALSLSFLLTPALGGLLPPPPDAPFRLAAFIAGEALIGILLGAVARIMISAAHTAGTLVATQSGLAAAMMLDMSQAGQSTVVTNLFTFTSVVLIFALDLHHGLLRALADSYSLFSPGVMPPLADFSEHAAKSLGKAFSVALQLSAPFIAVGIILNLAGGILARLMPTIQIFFLLMPVQIMLTFFVLMATVSGIFLWYMEYIEEGFGSFLAPAG